MKRVWMLILVILTALLATACADGENKTTQAEKENGAEQVVSDESATVPVQETETVPEETQPQLMQEILPDGYHLIELGTTVESDMVSFTLTQASCERSGKYVICGTITNMTSRKLTFTLEGLTFENWMQASSSYYDVISGESRSVSFSIMDTSGGKIDLTDPDRVDFILTGVWDMYSSEEADVEIPIAFFPNGREAFVPEAWDSEGRVLYEDGNLLIGLENTYLENSYMPSVELYIENKSDKSQSFVAMGGLVNGVECSMMLWQTIPAGKRAYCSVYIMGLSEALGSAEAEKVEIPIFVTDPNDIEAIVYSGLLTIKP